MRDHEELGAFPLGRSPPLAPAASAAAAASSTTTSTTTISNGRPPLASSAAPATTGNYPFPPSLSVPAPPPPRRTLSSLSTTTLHSSSVASRMDESVASLSSSSASTSASVSASAPASASASANDSGMGASLGFGFRGTCNSGNGSSSGTKRPLASLNPNSSSSSTSGADGTAGASTQGSGGGDCSVTTTMMEDGAAIYHPSTSGTCPIPSSTSHRGAAATSGAISPAWSAFVSSAPSMAICGPPATAHGTQPPSSNKRPRPTPTLTAIRHRLASKLIAAVQKTPHSDVARPYTAVVEWLNGEEQRACGSYGLFFTPDQARTREGWEVREVAARANRTTTATTTVWTLYGSAASEWIQSAMEGGGSGGGGGTGGGDFGGAQPAARQPYHIHPVPYDGPVRVGYGGKRQRMYAYAGVEALEAKLETSDTVGNSGGDGMLTLTVRTYLAGLVDEAKVTFSPWG